VPAETRQNLLVTHTPRLGARWGLVALVLLVACGARPEVSPFATSGSTSSAATATEVQSTDTAPSTTGASVDRHPGHDALAAALPTADQLTWLPASVQRADDSDLTTRLSIPDCSGQSTPLPSRETSASNRGFDDAGGRLLEITFYDVETADGAHRFIDAIDGYFRCPTLLNTEVTSASMTIGDVSTTKCDEAVAVRTHQPVSQTVDEWCRVGNLLAWIRLEPTGPDISTGIAAPGDTSGLAAPGENLTPPTDEHALATIVVVGEHLRAAFDASS
jgi:hypothetical protein